MTICSLNLICKANKIHTICLRFTPQVKCFCCETYIDVDLLQIVLVFAYGETLFVLFLMITLIYMLYYHVSRT